MYYETQEDYLRSLLFEIGGNGGSYNNNSNNYNSIGATQHNRNSSINATNINSNNIHPNNNSAFQDDEGEMEFNYYNRPNLFADPLAMATGTSPPLFASQQLPPISPQQIPLESNIIAEDGSQDAIDRRISRDFEVSPKLSNVNGNMIGKYSNGIQEQLCGSAEEGSPPSLSHNQIAAAPVGEAGITQTMTSIVANHDSEFDDIEQDLNSQMQAISISAYPNPQQPYSSTNTASSYTQIGGINAYAGNSSFQLPQSIAGVPPNALGREESDAFNQGPTINLMQGSTQQSRMLTPIAGGESGSINSTGANQNFLSKIHQKQSQSSQSSISQFPPTSNLQQLLPQYQSLSQHTDPQQQQQQHLNHQQQQVNRLQQYQYAHNNSFQNAQQPPPSYSQLQSNPNSQGYSDNSYQQQQQRVQQLPNQMQNQQYTQYPQQQVFNNNSASYQNNSINQYHHPNNTPYQPHFSLHNNNQLQAQPQYQQGLTFPHSSQSQQNVHHSQFQAKDIDQQQGHFIPSNGVSQQQQVIQQIPSQQQLQQQQQQPYNSEYQLQEHRQSEQQRHQQNLQANNDAYDSYSNCGSSYQYNNNNNHFCCSHSHAGDDEDSIPYESESSRMGAYSSYAQENSSSYQPYEHSQYSSYQQMPQQSSTQLSQQQQQQQQHQYQQQQQVQYQYENTQLDQQQQQVTPQQYNEININQAQNQQVPTKESILITPINDTVINSVILEENQTTKTKIRARTQQQSSKSLHPYKKSCLKEQKHEQKYKRAKEQHEEGQRIFKGLQKQSNDSPQQQRQLQQPPQLSLNEQMQPLSLESQNHGGNIQVNNNNSIPSVDINKENNRITIKIAKKHTRRSSCHGTENTHSHHHHREVNASKGDEKEDGDCEVGGDFSGGGEGSWEKNSRTDEIAILADSIKHCNKKNVVKNIMSAFLTFMNDRKFKLYTEDEQECIPALYHCQDTSAATDEDDKLEEIRKKFKRYISQKSLNHYTVRLLILHPNYGPIFRHYLTNPIKKWINASKVADLSAHVKMIGFFLACFQDNKVLEELKRHEKKRAHFS